MRKTVILCCVLLGFSSVYVLSAHATIPSPTRKPLSSETHSGFVEGVDVPAVKPDSSKTAKEPSKLPSIQPAECEIKSAVFEQIAPVDGASDGDEGCGIAEPVRLSGIKHGETFTVFSEPVTVSCGFAMILAEWLIEDVLPAADQHLAKSIETLKSGPGYQCRRRNNQPDGKLSEHALGKAIDLSGFKLVGGSLVSIEKDWGNETKHGQFLKAIHVSACKRFSTVLGPDADPNHKSHFHLDTGCHGKSCTYLICQ